MNWHMIGVCIASFSVAGALILAAAKSIFITKTDFSEAVKKIEAQLYDAQHLPIFVPRREWDGEERRRDVDQQALRLKMSDVEKSIQEVGVAQGRTDLFMQQLLSRFDTYWKV